MNDTKLILIPGRTMKQGTGMNIGKESDDYQKAVTTIEMNRDDMVCVGVQDGDTVRVKASGGQATVQCRGADLPEGMAFIAYGPASSELMDRETHGSGFPAGSSTPPCCRGSRSRGALRARPVAKADRRSAASPKVHNAQPPDPCTDPMRAQPPPGRRRR